MTRGDGLRRSQGVSRELMNPVQSPCAEFQGRSSVVERLKEAHCTKSTIPHHPCTRSACLKGSSGRVDLQLAASVNTEARSSPAQVRTYSRLERLGMFRPPPAIG